MMKWVIENWFLIVALVAVITVVIGAVCTFLKLPTATQIAALKEWLKYAVAMAEKELGSGTGQLKLRMVYDLFVEKFAWLATAISFERFSDYVDEALEWLNQQLSSNPQIVSVVNGKSETGVGTEEKVLEE